MTQKIRLGVFETNSSSSHTLTITGGTYDCDALYVDEDGICRLAGGEFGWGVDIHREALWKAAYCITFLSRIVDDPEAEYGQSWAPPDNDDPCFQLFRAVICEATGARDIEVVADACASYPYGYIDHQSQATCAAAFASTQTLRDFIFNRESYLLVSNDNLACGNMIEDALANGAAIEDAVSLMLCAETQYWERERG